MDYETFESLFDKMHKEKELKVGAYTVDYGKDNDSIRVGYTQVIYYFRDGYMLGTDSIREFYEPGSIMPRLETSFDKKKGIKNFDKLIDYLDYLYETNIDRLKEEERQREQRRLEYLKEEERKQRKLNDFINTNKKYMK